MAHKILLRPILSFIEVCCFFFHGNCSTSQFLVFNFLRFYLCIFQIPLSYKNGNYQLERIQIKLQWPIRMEVHLNANKSTLFSFYQAFFLFALSNRRDTNNMAIQRINAVLSMFLRFFFSLPLDST